MSLFHIQVDISCTGQVKWQQLCSYLLLEYSERERASIPRAALQDSQQQLRHCSHNKVRPTGLNLLNDKGMFRLHPERPDVMSFRNTKYSISTALSRDGLHPLHTHLSRDCKQRAVCSLYLVVVVVLYN